MKRFGFRLQKVLEVRALREKTALQEYRATLTELNALQQELVRLETLIAANLAKHRGVNRRFAPDLIVMVERYIGQLKGLQLIQIERISLQEEKVRAALEKWKERHREKLLIEKIRERKWREYLREVDRQDQIVQDDLFLAKINREREI